MTIQDSIIQALQASHDAHQSGLAALVASQTAHQAALAEIDVLWQDKAELEATIADLQAKVVSLQSKVADLEAKVAHHESESVKIVEPDTVNPLLDWLSQAVAATYSAIVPSAPAKQTPPAAVPAEPPPPEVRAAAVPPAPAAPAAAEPPPHAPEGLAHESAADTAPAAVHDAPVHRPEPEAPKAPPQEMAAPEPSVIKIFASEAFAAISLKDEPHAKPEHELVPEPVPEQKSA